MNSIMAKGPISGLLDKLFSAFCKSLSNLFSEGDVDSSVSYEKGRSNRDNDILEGSQIVEETTKVFEIRDDNGNVLREDAAVAEFTTTLVWPADQPMKRKDAEQLMKKADTWTKADKVNLAMSFKKSDKIAKENIDGKQAGKEIDKYIEKHEIATKATKITYLRVLVFNEGEPSTDTNSSKKLNMTLQKITSGTDVQVNLVKVNANYDLAEVTDDIDSIISDDDFVDQLPENDKVAYEVISEDSEYDVNPCCEDYECDESIHQMINQTFFAITQLHMIQMAATGDEYNQIVQACETIRYQLDVVMSVLSDTLYDMNCNAVPDVNIYLEPLYYDRDDLLDLIATYMSTYLKSLETVYVNFSRGNQTKLDFCIQTMEDAVRTAKRKS